MHRAEAAKVNAIRQAQLLRRRLELTMKQVVAVKRLANSIGEYKIIRLAELLVALPHDLQCIEDDTVPVERNFALSGLGLHQVELIVVNALVHHDAIRQAVLPSQGKYFA